MSEQTSFRTWRYNEHWDRDPCECVAELEREANIRIRCYDKWVAEGRVTKDDAVNRLERLLTSIRLLREGLAKAANEREINRANGTTSIPKVVIPASFRQAAG